MSRIKQALVATAGIVVGAVTLRRLRKRRQSATEEIKQAEEEDSKSPKTEAAEETKAAASHALTAGEKASEYAREQVETVRD